ncbi:beta-glucosidase [Isoptericola jiangsuensis]|uniref:Beta-glucosidase n=1 Tax=Isoptericola jiangsuensis TaxID=548579 RepID=A0A2A9ES13_9MICO|nr:glycoside hydrolase family 3 C-terminal domain-containing protein [Isoptericola jiangsuensis]PFG41927.1 beta-glucosidase [Isoptericola jiangsuensis]
MSLPTATDRTAVEAALDALVAALTLDEKTGLVVGADLWATRGLERIGLDPVVMSDGPVGVRDPYHGGASAMLPAPSALAATWDVALAARTGDLFAAEARRHGVHLVLAPQVNLQRTPVGGRHFECYSEDPHLTAEVAVALVSAAQRAGTGMCVKHYVANDSETDRTRYLARVDARTLREVYLAPFERLVDAGSWSVMGAYSGVDDGATAAPALEHRPLLTGVLKDEWGFDGLVVSDWVATRTVAAAVRGGLDLQMPGPDGVWGDGLRDAVLAGDVAEADLDDKVRRLLRLAHRLGRLDLPGTPASDAAPAQRWTPGARATFLRELAARATVVLKDDAGLVPLPGTEEGAPLRVALLGANAVAPFFQGGGSSLVTPDRLSYPADALVAALPDGSHVDVVAGSRALRNPAPLDPARCTDPVTGEPGLRLELLGVDGAVRRTETRTTWDGWYADLGADDAVLRLRARVRLDEPGAHELGVGTVGVHRVAVDAEVVSTGDVVATEDVILASTHNHPVARTVTVTGPEVELTADLQVVHPVGYDRFVRGQLVHRLPGATPAEDLAAAEAAARAADVAVVVVGTTHEVESEGFDRPDLDLPGNQDELVRRVVAANPRTVVVVNAGAPVLLPWLDDVPTVLWGWLAGQEAGAALTDVLTGVTEPGGRLPWTLPARFEDVPVPHAVPVDGVVDYVEGLDVGYRGWSRRTHAAAGPAPAAPFGHGLGWTTWRYDDVTLVDGSAAGPVVRVTVTNTGTRHGREVVQVYVEPDAAVLAADPQRPVRTLGAFAVVEADPGSTSTVDVPVPARALQVWDVAAGTWTTPPGRYRLRAGRSVTDLRGGVEITVEH